MEGFTFTWHPLFNNAFLCASFSIHEMYDWVGTLRDNKSVPYKLLSPKKVEQFVQLQTFYKSQINGVDLAFILNNPEVYFGCGKESLKMKKCCLFHIW